MSQISSGCQTWVALRNRRRRLSQQKRRSAHDCKVSGASLEIAKLVTWLSNGQEQLGVKFLESRCEESGRKRLRAPSHQSLSPVGDAADKEEQSWREEMAKYLSNKWLTWSVDDEVAAITSNPWSLTKAKEFIIEEKLEQWIKCMNMKALAPTSKAVIGQRRELDRSSWSAPLLPSTEDKDEPLKNRRWLTRWCQKKRCQAREV